MYEVDKRDRVIELRDVPQSSPGAPIPLVLGDEHTVVLAYYMQELARDWDGSTVRVVGPESAEEPIAIVRFNGCQAHMFGPPNDEAFRGHPLAGKGLHPYGVFLVEESSWIRKLERMNSVHRYHDPDRFWSLQHLIFSFHDSVFECVCRGFEAITTRGSILDAVPEMVALLNWRRS
jgi:hypothetical protein